MVNCKLGRCYPHAFSSWRLIRTYTCARMTLCNAGVWDRLKPFSNYRSMKYRWSGWIIWVDQYGLKARCGDSRLYPSAYSFLWQLQNSGVLGIHFCIPNDNQTETCGWLVAFLWNLERDVSQRDYSLDGSGTRWKVNSYRTTIIVPQLSMHFMERKEKPLLGL